MQRDSLHYRCTGRRPGSVTGGMALDDVMYVSVGSLVSVCSSFCRQLELNSDKLLVLASEPAVKDLEFELS